MMEEKNGGQARTCPQCENHCPADGLKCGKGRKYFGVEDGGGHGREHGHGRHRDGLAGLLHRCGRFVRHTELEEDELFQALTEEEKTDLQAALEKLAADWTARCGEESFGHGHRHGGKHGDHHK